MWGIQNSVYMLLLNPYVCFFIVLILDIQDSVVFFDELDSLYYTGKQIKDPQGVPQSKSKDCSPSLEPGGRIENPQNVHTGANGQHDHLTLPHSEVITILDGRNHKTCTQEQTVNPNISLFPIVR